jgi:DNA-binding NarL/FixJ family response regulator
MVSASMLRVLHCDDDKTFRFLVRAVLDEEGDIELTGEAADARSCIEQTAALRPDVVLLDESMPGMSGLEAVPRIRDASPSTRIVVLSSFPADELRARALDLGAAAYLEKHGIVTTLAEAVRDVARVA